MVVCLVCLCVALWWTGDLSRVNPASCPMTAGIGSSPPCDPTDGLSGYRKSMDYNWLELHCIFKCFEMTFYCVILVCPHVCKYKEDWIFLLFKSVVKVDTKRKGQSASNLAFSQCKIRYITFSKGLVSAVCLSDKQSFTWHCLSVRTGQH